MDGHPRGLIVIILIMLLNAVVSLARSAFENVNEAITEKRAAEGDKRAIRLNRHLSNPVRYYNTVGILLNASCIIIGIIYSLAYYEIIREGILKIDFISSIGRGKYFITDVLMFLTIFILIYLVVLFCSLIPKHLGVKYAESMAYRLCGIIELFTVLLKPAGWLLEKNTGLILRIFGINPNDLEDNVTEEEIISIVNEGQEQGVIEAEEAEMISNIIEFTDKQVRDIMTHRKKIVAVDSNMSIESAMKFMLGESFTRFPLYTDNIDNIVGVIHLKDAMKCFMESSNKRNGRVRSRRLTDIAMKPYYIPDTQNIDVLFHDMQSKNVHMAIAIDEYGQTAGIVAMEDILEEIVGEIQDEYDIEEELIVKENEDAYLVDGEITLSELAEETGLVPDEEDAENYDTLNGLLISILGRIMNDGETDTVEYCGFCFEILEVKDKMINLVRISKLHYENTDTGTEEEETGAVTESGKQPADNGQ